MADPKFHPALAVTNIKNLVSVTLEMDKGQYNSWAELFRIHCRAYNVLEHIIPAKPSSSADKDKQPVRDEALWARLDAIVLQWIYSTISNDLLHTIIETDSTAQQAWDRLKNIFQDNKHSRAVYLDAQFHNTRLDNFANVSSYCQELKMLSDQLSNVGAPVSNQRLVLQLISGLNENYDTVATHLQQSDPLPPFYEARSKLILEESRKAQTALNAANTAATALLNTNNNSDDSHSPTPGPNQQQRPRGTNGRGRGRGSYNNNNRNISNNRGRGRGRNNANQQQGSFMQSAGPQQSPSPTYPPTWPYNLWGWMQSPWSMPPCPFPTSGPTRPPNNTRGAGVLGPRPPQSYMASHSSTYAPTDIEQALHSMNINVPDENWYMDTGATSHMAGSSGFPDGDSTHEM